MVFLKVVLVGLASPRGLTVQCFPQEDLSPTPPFHFRCVGPCKFQPGYPPMKVVSSVRQRWNFWPEVVGLCWQIWRGGRVVGRGCLAEPEASKR